MGVKLLEEILADFFNYCNNYLVNLIMQVLHYNTIFDCENVFETYTGIDITPVANTIFGYAFYLLSLKFAWKCFNIYILGTDGSDDIDPMVLLINFAKALVVSLGFGLLFSYIMGIASEITDDVLTTLNLTYEHVPWADPTNISFLTFMTIFFVLAIVLAVMFIKSAIQLVTLRVGISFAALGLLDSDGGVFKPFIKKFYQICLGALLQIACFKIAMICAASSYTTPISFLWAFAFISMALSAPVWLSEFIMAGQSGGKFQQIIYSISMLRGFGGKAAGAANATNAANGG